MIGENGAGKSTLMKILSGVYQADAGVMMVDGKEVHYHEPRQALHDGICMIYQELNLVQHLSVGDNIFIGRESKKGWKLDRTKDNTPHDAVKNGIGYISEDRKALGLALKLSVADNIAMPNWEKFTSHGVVNEKEEMRVASEMADRVMVKTPSVKQLVMNLSGGNQQKVAIAKWLLRDCDILIFDEPTRGIDIGAKSEIYNLMNALIAQGKSIIMISSEMQELLSMSDRIIVMCEGSITGELDIADASQESIMALAVQRAV